MHAQNQIDFSSLKKKSYMCVSSLTHRSQGNLGNSPKHNTASQIDLLHAANNKAKESNQQSRIV